MEPVRKRLYLGQESEGVIYRTIHLAGYWAQGQDILAWSSLQQTCSQLCYQSMYGVDLSFESGEAIWYLMQLQQSSSYATGTK